MKKINKFQKYCIENSIKGSVVDPFVYNQFKKLVGLDVRILLTGNFFYDDIVILKKCVDTEVYSLFDNLIEHYCDDKLKEYKI